MKIGLIIQGALAAFLLLVGLLCVAAAQRFYPATLPFLIAATVCVVLAIIGISLPGKRALMFWGLTLLHGSLFFPFWLAMTHWPGGDDGPGMMWMILVGGGACLAGALAVVFLIVGLISWHLGRQKTVQ